jgi:hypothetical protein
LFNTSIRSVFGPSQKRGQKQGSSWGPENEYFCDFLRLFHKLLKNFYNFHKKILKKLKSLSKKSFLVPPQSLKKHLFLPQSLFGPFFALDLILTITKNFKKSLQKKHNFLQIFPKFPVFGPFLGSGRVPPKSGQKWQKWWSTAIGLRTLGDGIGIYLVPEIWEKKGQIWKILQKVVISYNEIFKFVTNFCQELSLLLFHFWNFY